MENVGSADELFLEFDSSQVPRQQRFATWAQAMPFYECSSDVADDFHVHGSAWLKSPMFVVAAQMDEMRVIRTVEALRKDARDDLLVRLISEGSMEGEAEGRPFHAAAGEVVIHDLSRPLRPAFTFGGHVAAVFPAGFLEHALPDSDLHGLVLSAPTVDLFRAFMLALPETPSWRVQRGTSLPI